MLSRSRVLLAAVAALSLAINPVPAAPPGGGSKVVSLERHSLSQDNVLGILLLLISQEDEKMRQALDALYESGFVSTEMGSGGDVERYVASIFAARYKPIVSKAVFGAMMGYQRLVAKELRRPAPSSPSGLRSAVLRVASGLEKPALEQFTTNLSDWLRVLDGALGSVQGAELDMIQLQSLVSQRQLAISMTANLMRALAEAAKQVAANIGSSPPTQSEASSSGGAGSDQSCPPCGCSCP